MNIKYLLFFLLFLSACAEPEKENDPVPDNQVPVIKKLSSQEIIRHIESQLKIDGTEKYGIEFYEAYLNPDDSLDKIVTVNLLDRAKKEAMASDIVAKRASMGYMGNYNYFFFIDGESGAITSPIVVPSSPIASLKISFENIISEANKDIVIDIKINDSKYRKYYTIAEGAPFQICETELYTDVTKSNRKAYTVEYEEGTYSLAKNIVIYEGIVDKIETKGPHDIYNIDPEITPTDKLVRRWYYSPQHMKYYLRKDEI